MSNTTSLAGKFALITGSTQGLGEVTARLFAQRGAAGIIVTGRNAERGQAVADAVSTANCRVVFVPAELAEAQDCRRLIAAAEETFGTLHVLVNAAALTERGSVWDTSPALFDRMMTINVRAPFLLMQDAIKLMERSKAAGSIVNISSVAAHGSVPMLTAYAASKGALDVLTKNIAYSVAWRRIRVNALNLGWMDTPNEDAIQRRYHSEGRDWLPQAEAKQPFGRLLKTDEVARAIAFLASDESGMMTGALIDFDQSVIGAGPQPIPPPIETWDKIAEVSYS
ncbi:MAG: SDR family oxidoreductase [Rhizobiales bacterium]|nr:SDR family oxidoreductase [Hyphomicrobiales bacterium]